MNGDSLDKKSPRENPGIVAEEKTKVKLIQEVIRQEGGGRNMRPDQVLSWIYGNRIRQDWQASM
jgi:hypothetical protein